LQAHLRLVRLRVWRKPDLVQRNLVLVRSKLALLARRLEQVSAQLKLERLD
jgi:hypothetical protein